MICCLVVRGVTLCWRPPCGFRSVGGCVCSRPRSCACCPPWPWLGRRVVAGGGVSFRRFPFFRAVAALCCRGGWFWVSTCEGQGLGCGTPGVRDVLRRVVFVVGSVSASRIFSHFSWASCSLSFFVKGFIIALSSSNLRFAGPLTVGCTASLSLVLPSRCSG